MKNFAKERDTAFIKAVMEDDWEPVKKYARKYGAPLPSNTEVMKAGVYKAVQHCARIPDEVKEAAMCKCFKLGFSPLIKGMEEQT